VRTTTRNQGATTSGCDLPSALAVDLRPRGCELPSVSAETCLRVTGAGACSASVLKNVAPGANASYSRSGSNSRRQRGPTASVAAQELEEEVYVAE
jgi:hypothetical protein